MKKISFLLIFVMSISLFSACGSQDSVDADKFDSLIGEYQVVAQDNDNPELSVGSWWHLSIRNDEEPYLSIYDNEAGNPGVEGKVVALDESNIKVEINPDLTDELPSSEWSLDGKYLVMTYEKNGETISLTNSGKTLEFSGEKQLKTLCGHWKAEGSDQLEEVSFQDGKLIVKGWNYECSGQEDVGGIWAEEDLEFAVAEDCTFTDAFFGSGEVTQDEFAGLLGRSDATYSVVEMDVDEDTVYAMRLVEVDESGLED